MPPASIDAYLATVPADQRAALEALRQRIHAIAPDAEECIAYGVPAFCWHGKPLVGFAAAAHHCSLFPISGAIVSAFADELASFSTSKGTIRFQPDRPLPDDLLRRIVERRMAMIDG